MLAEKNSRGERKKREDEPKNESRHEKKHEKRHPPRILLQRAQASRGARGAAGQPRRGAALTQPSHHAAVAKPSVDAARHHHHTPNPALCHTCHQRECCCGGGGPDTSLARLYHTGSSFIDDGSWLDHTRPLYEEAYGYIAGVDTASFTSSVNTTNNFVTLTPTTTLAAMQAATGLSALTQKGQTMFIASTLANDRSRPPWSVLHRRTAVGDERHVRAASARHY